MSIFKDVLYHLFKFKSLGNETQRSVILQILRQFVFLLFRYAYWILDTTFQVTCYLESFQNILLLLAKNDESLEERSSQSCIEVSFWLKMKFAKFTFRQAPLSKGHFILHKFIINFNLFRLAPRLHKYNVRQTKIC